MAVTQDMTDEMFEEEIFKELDCSKLQQQRYIGVSYITSKEMPSLEDEEEKVTIAYKKLRTIDDMYEKRYFTQDEMPQITAENWNLINKCVGIFQPLDEQDKRRYTIDDIRGVCEGAFMDALYNYPRETSGAKFITFAYHCMSNACRDYKRIMRAKKRGVAESLSDPVKRGTTDSNDRTLEEVIPDENSSPLEKKETEIDINGLVEKVFPLLEPKYRAILGYRFGIGEWGYEHTELEIAVLFGVSRETVKKMIREAEDSFRFILYREGLIEKAESLSKEYFGTSDERFSKVMAGAQRKYNDLLSSEDGDFV